VVELGETDRVASALNDVLAVIVGDRDAVGVVEGAAGGGGLSPGQSKPIGAYEGPGSACTYPLAAIPTDHDRVKGPLDENVVPSTITKMRDACWKLDTVTIVP
jgi:hypothetical protein